MNTDTSNVHNLLFMYIYYCFSNIEVSKLVILTNVYENKHTFNHHNYYSSYKKKLSVYTILNKSILDDMFCDATNKPLHFLKYISVFDIKI